MLIFAEGCYRIYKTETVRCACYLVSCSGKSVLIDTSMAFERRAVLKSLKRAGIERLAAVFLTHGHTDHAANARYLADTYACPVYVSPAGLESVRNGVCVMPRGTQPFSRLVCTLERLPFLNRFERFDACPNALPLTPEAVRHYLGDGVLLMDTPGHSADSVSFIIDNRIALVGDSAVSVRGTHYPPFADDEALLKQTWASLLQTGTELYCPAHGKPFPHDAFVEAYNNLKSL